MSTANADIGFNSVPIERVMPHVRDLMATGWTLRAIADECGVSYSLLRNLMGKSRLQQTVSIELASRLWRLPRKPMPPVEDWSQDAECLGMDVDLFFPAVGRVGAGRIQWHQEAVDACKRCPVRRQCLDDAKPDEQTYRGGMTPSQRAEHRRARK